MNPRILFLAVLALSLFLCSVSADCTVSGSECQNKGICDSDSLCACGGKWTDASCSTEVAPTPAAGNPAYAAAKVDISANKFAPEVVLDLLDSNGATTGTLVNAKITVKVPSQEDEDQAGSGKNFALPTTFAFTGTSKSCNYPTAAASTIAWARSIIYESSTWYDVYTTTILINNLKSSCNFALSTDGTFASVLNIKRAYTLKSGSFILTRTNEIQRKISIKFPTVVVSQNVITVEPSSVSATSKVVYDHSQSKWTVEIVTAIQTPYKITSIESSGAVNSVGTDTRVWSTPTFTASATTCSGANCQYITFELLKDSAGAAAEASNPVCGAIKTAFSVSAKASCATCDPSTVTVTISLNVETTSACPVSQAYSVQPVLASDKTTYGYSESPQFTVTYNLPSDIQTFTAVAFKRICVAPVSGECTTGYTVSQNYHTEKTNTPGSFVFTFDNAGRLRDLIEGVQTSGNGKFTVQVDLSFTYSSGVVKRGVSVIDHSITATLVVDAPVVEQQLALPSSASSFTLQLIAALCAVAVAML